MRVPASTLGACQNAAMVTLKCAKYKESHFKAHSIKKAGRLQRYSEGSVSGSVDRARKQHRPRPRGRELHRTGRQHCSLLPNVFFFFLRANGKEAGCEIKRG